MPSEENSTKCRIEKTKSESGRTKSELVFTDSDFVNLQNGAKKRENKHLACPPHILLQRYNKKERNPNLVVRGPPRVSFISVQKFPSKMKLKKPFTTALKMKSPTLLKLGISVTFKPSIKNTEELYKILQHYKCCNKLFKKYINIITHVITRVIHFL